MSDDTEFTREDAVRWQRLLASGLHQSNIFETVQAWDGPGVPDEAEYVLRGRVTRFRFEKNWVPTFFPVHLGLTFLTFTGYTLFGGPTTATIVRFAVEVELFQAHPKKLIATFSERYHSTRAVNIYSSGAENPYENPNLVFSQIVDSLATKIAAALPAPEDTGRLTRP